MAIAVIGGVFTSTVLSLVVVPVAYTLMDDTVGVAARLFHRGARVTVPSQPVTPDAIEATPEADPEDDPPSQDKPAQD
jgi:hypothetical protein